jgi:hypothetical protein
VKAHVAIIYFVVALVAMASWAYEGNPITDLPFAVEVSPADVGFHVDGPPGLYPSSAPVTISVRSGFAEWTLYMQASPLVEVTRGWVVPASRIFVEGGFQDVMADEAGLVGLGQPIMVATGEFTGPVFEVKAVLDLQMMSQGTDRPGTYRGQIILTFLATP